MGSLTTVILIKNITNIVLHRATRYIRRTLSIEIIKTKKQRSQRRQKTPLLTVTTTMLRWAIMGQKLSMAPSMKTMATSLVCPLVTTMLGNSGWISGFYDLSWF